LKKIKDFWIQSYQSDKIAFMCELTSFVFTVGASTMLAMNADEPDMRIIYPGFFVGSVTAVYGYYRRTLAWPMLLTSYFTVANILGFGVAMGYW
jgi:hypothetical protein|tara:strand:+ start:3738 stop:4019 length:282 start_codon:yes stop_codon:yes gene_type:complete